MFYKPQPKKSINLPLLKTGGMNVYITEITLRYHFCLDNYNIHSNSIKSVLIVNEIRETFSQNAS